MGKDFSCLPIYIYIFVCEWGNKEGDKSEGNRRRELPSVQAQMEPEKTISHIIHSITVAKTSILFLLSGWMNEMAANSNPISSMSGLKEALSNHFFFLMQQNKDQKFWENQKHYSNCSPIQDSLKNIAHYLFIH